MSNENPKPEGAVTETPPIELLEKTVSDMLDGKGIDASDWPWTLRDFRKALDTARRGNTWNVVDLAFKNIVSVSFEMLLRSQLAMRLHMDSLTQRRGAESYPDIREDAERVERVARFILDAAVQYAKVRHVSSLVRRRDDPRILDFSAAREKASQEKTKAGEAEKKTEAVEA
jgi:hypothetical protein